jgi:hypothetical protein
MINPVAAVEECEMGDYFARKIFDKERPILFELYRKSGKLEHSFDFSGPYDDGFLSLFDDVCEIPENRLDGCLVGSRLYVPDLEKSLISVYSVRGRERAVIEDQVSLTFADPTKFSYMVDLYLICGQ